MVRKAGPANEEGHARRGADRAQGDATTATGPPLEEAEAPWTDEELAEVRAELTADAARLEVGADGASAELTELMREARQCAGEDEVEKGTAAYERAQGASLAGSARELLSQTLHALDRIEVGTYGTCEACNNLIGRRRLQAFPRAVLCRACKQEQERR